MNCPKCGLLKFFGIGGYAGPQCLCDVTVGPIVTISEFHNLIKHDDPLYKEGFKAGAASRDAEVARLKTVPMKYRRMEFNAQLQKENDQLREQVAMLREALLTCSAGDFSTGHVIYPSFDEKLVEEALAATETNE